MVVIEDFEMPESCFRCTKRKCLHIDGKAYQMCGLNEDGYLTESWFNSENVPIDYRSEHCPLREVEAIPKDQYENRLTTDMVTIKQLSNSVKVLRKANSQIEGAYDKLKSDYENRLKADMLAMLTDLQSEIEKESWTRECLDGSDETIVDMKSVNEVFQQKIKALEKK